MAGRMHHRSPPRGLAGLLGSLGLALCLVRGAGASLVATLDANTTQTGEPVHLSLAFTGGNPAEPPTPPEVTNLAFAYLGQSSQFQMVNGRTSSSLIFNYQVTASRPGEYTIPSIRAVVGNQTLASQPLRLVVGKGDDRLAQIAFLQLASPKSEAWLGEAMPLEIRLFAQGGRLAQPPQLKGEGVTIGKLAQTGATQVQTNGILYQLLTYRVAVTFVKTGEFKLTAGDCLLDVQLRRAGRQRDPFGIGLDDLFGGVENRRLNLASDPVPLRVRSLPAESVPAGFGGAVGDFNLSASLSTNVVTAGDPITLAVQIGGRGPIESLKWEAPGTWTGFKTYPPSIAVKTTDELGLAGVKTFEQAIIPDSPQVREVPPITFSFFDPDRRQYRTLTCPAKAITVKAAAVVPSQPLVLARPGLARPEEKAVTDIVHIKARPGMLARMSPPLLERPAFLALQSLPLLCWFSALAWRRRADRLARDPRLRRRQQVSRIVREGLIELRRLAAQNQREEFFGAVLHLLQAQLGERLQLPASAITEGVVEQHLQPLGPDPALIDATRDLFQLCNQARYAPTQHGGELMSLVPKVEVTLQRLQTLESHAKR
jgi:hypothetical protein